MRLGISMGMRFGFGSRNHRDMAKKGRFLYKQIKTEQRRLKRLGDPNFERNGVVNAMSPYQPPINYERYPKQEPLDVEHSNLL